MIDYSEMTYDQKNIMALRNAVMFIASVLSDEQKAHLEMLITSNVDEKLDETFDAPQAQVMKDIYKLTQEILSLRPEN